MFDFENCIFYPASGWDFEPVKLLSGKFRSFFYSDWEFKRAEVELLDSKFQISHYQYRKIECLNPRTVFGQELELDGIHRTEEIFTYRVIFDPLPDGPKELQSSLEILFTNREGVAALSAFRSRNIMPRIATYSRVGIAGGGNYANFRSLYARALEELGGIPFLLCDDEGLKTDLGPEPEDGPGYYFRYAENFPFEIFSAKCPSFYHQNRVLSLLSKSDINLEGKPVKDRWITERALQKRRRVR